VLAAARTEQGANTSGLTLKQGLGLHPWSVGLRWAQDGSFTSPVREHLDGWIEYPGITVSVPVPGLIASAATQLFIKQLGFFLHMTPKPITL